jgi:hypothetical protein
MTPRKPAATTHQGGRRTIVIAVVVSLLALAASGSAQVKVPPDFAFERGKDSPGPVTFSHEKHKERADKCTVCHVKVFKMKKGELCGSCHNGKTEVGGKVAFLTDDKA